MPRGQHCTMFYSLPYSKVGAKIQLFLQNRKFTAVNIALCPIEKATAYSRAPQARRPKVALRKAEPHILSHKSPPPPQSRMGAPQPPVCKPFSERYGFALQKVRFCTAKGMVSPCHTLPFAFAQDEALPVEGNTLHGQGCCFQTRDLPHRPTSGLSPLGWKTGNGSSPSTFQTYSAAIR